VACHTAAATSVSNRSAGTGFPGDVPAALPTLVGGQRQVLSMPADQEVRVFIVDLAWRAEHFDPKRPDMDNILKVTSDGRNVSLDPRLGNLAAPLNGGRAGAVAEQIMRIHHANADTVYRDDAGAPAPIPGALQIVFCDRATPNKNGRWSIYDGVRDELVARGMDPAGVRFVHDYPKAGEKAQLFADCRNGRVSVLLGSTEKMGTGTNIQDRAIALHHLDVPWRPADLEQREGRLIRQGNQNPEVEICNYVTEATFDTVMWQTVERKARFIAQIKTGDLDARTAEDIGSDELGNAAAATKAVATGDPRYLQQVQLDDDVKRLTALKHAYGDAQARHRSEQRTYSREVAATTEQREAIDAALPQIRATADAPFAITINDHHYTDRAEAAPALVHAARQAYSDGKQFGQQRAFPIAELRGVEVQASRWLSSDELALSLSIPSATNTVAAQDLNAGAGGCCGGWRTWCATQRTTASRFRAVTSMRCDAPTSWPPSRMPRSNTAGTGRQTERVGAVERAAADRGIRPGGPRRGRRGAGADGGDGPQAGVEFAAQPDAGPVGRYGCRPGRVQGPHCPGGGQRPGTPG